MQFDIHYGWVLFTILVEHLYQLLVKSHVLLLITTRLALGISTLGFVSSVLRGCNDIFSVNLMLFSLRGRFGRLFVYYLLVCLLSVFVQKVSRIFPFKVLLRPLTDQTPASEEPIEMFTFVFNGFFVQSEQFILEGYSFLTLHLSFKLFSLLQRAFTLYFQKNFGQRAFTSIYFRAGGLCNCIF